MDRTDRSCCWIFEEIEANRLGQLYIFMIKAIITDIDGIIIGEKIGFNSPHPHSKVLRALKIIREKGIPICLCSGKPHYAIGEVIKRAELHNPHITDGGAVTIDPID